MFVQLIMAFIVFCLYMIPILAIIRFIVTVIGDIVLNEIRRQSPHVLDRDAAIAKLNTVIMIDPWNADAHEWRGFLSKDPHSSLSDYHIAAKLYKNQGKEYEYKRVLESIQRKESCINEETVRYEQNKQSTKSTNNEVVTLPHYAFAYIARGNKKSISGDYQGALIEYSEAIRINPKIIEAYIYRGIVKSFLEDHNGAINDFTEVIRMKPNDEYSSQGSVFAAGTVADFNQNQAIIFDPNKHNHRAFAYNRRGIAKGKLGDHRGAISDFTEAIRISAEDAEIYTNRGISKAALGNCEEAIADYNQAICINPNLTEAYTNRGYMKCGLQDYQGAIADFTQTIRINPDSDEGYNNRGIAKYLSGDKYGALADYDQGIRIKSNDGETHNNRGIVKSELGDVAGAVVDLRKAAEIFKAQGNPEYQNVLKRINALS
jgi:tetratricopeptide (TPR) repeat protein